MSNNFNIREIVEIAIHIEEKGKVLYETLEKASQDRTIKMMWQYLKEQEELHRVSFQKILGNMRDYVVYEFVPGEYEAYLRAISSLYIFAGDKIDEKIRQGFTSELEAIEFAIAVEKESILIYSEFKQYVVLEKQQVVTQIIDEEKRHLVQLLLLRNNKFQKSK